MFILRNEAPADVGAREALLDGAFGPARFLKASERIRKGRLPAEGLALVAEDAAGRLVATVRLWHVSAGGRAALLLGPLAVSPDLQGQGLGATMMRRAMAAAADAGHGAVILVGDPEYYTRFGFSAAPTARLSMPGPTERRRFLACELRPGALQGAAGRIVPTGARIGSVPALPAAAVAA
ncbi:Predicted N-acetyltransferase YhbS [Pseudoxanthobacter soli DSM 19599]|uniref:Predicted N-acetyltransferase YhbS n=1 Tax=Pseudoxanthobacter soli DSM 19599 TaxID=1123029 RepID=A0A1M7ZI20_9HYPH|nr:N-acetyltransferase [Pseudoxanthobacter soli]SHO64479.1 Predicted N-acetyltransferase YhbS [Pseudoxanthobacter soli DSM 19599]